MLTFKAHESRARIFHTLCQFLVVSVPASNEPKNQLFLTLSAHSNLSLL